MLVTLYAKTTDNDNASKNVQQQISFTFPSSVRPLTVEIKKPAETGEGGVLTAERRYEVACESAGSRPPAVITWYKGKRQLKRITVSEHYFIENYTILTCLECYNNLLAPK